MSIAQNRVCLMLGSNINPEENIQRALRKLEQIFPVGGISAVWETPALGSAGPNFLNVAMVIYTSLDPRILKERVLRPLEARLGRLRTADKNAPRTLDIDIIAWNAVILDHDVWQHAHLAVPVAELLPCYQSDETGEYLEQAARRLSRMTPIRPRPEVRPAHSIVTA
jgi:2-amino-4-hydroxy-6-hydroxymethyldihydropteridine diphosphokinase